MSRTRRRCSTRVRATNRRGFREVGVTLNQIRQDRQLEEALTRGAGALHLAFVFGISERAAMRYADAARAFLESPLEQ
ncbi:hypothetical protein [Streptomyces atratus]|uniref:hypothetical protein n=1 Tax=Streptomyces atratus TaxID=1893 RepID=UPI0022598922|nr:hypothetical protein [Streptomyces atratus]MCX5338687.1 hypothetical protein [Streptomyces atratus]